MKNYFLILNFKFIDFKKLNNIFLINIYFLNNFFFINELIWQEGLLFDFLQKKIIDNWIKKFIIYSANLFNERLVFEKIIFFFLNLIIWPAHNFLIFDFNNISNILFIFILFFILFSFFFSFLFLIF